MQEASEQFDCCRLDDVSDFRIGRLPERLQATVDFEIIWQLHPNHFHEIKMHGRLVKTPRWQQAYGVDYQYSGQVNRGESIPLLLNAFLAWSQETIDRRLNGLLLNWYDGTLGHYIGRHRDSTKNLIPGAPIVTISLGDERTFRLRPWPAKLKGLPIDFPARHGTVFVMPWDTNLRFTHEVPASARHTGRRISITLRAFADEFAAQRRRNGQSDDANDL